MPRFERSCSNPQAEFEAASLTLQALPAGLHHARCGGYWVMIGRALPEPKVWTSLPPAHSLSIVWGGGGARIGHAGGVFDLGPDRVMWIDAGCGHRGEGFSGSDFLTVFAPDLQTRDRTPSVRVGPLRPELRDLLIRLAAAALEGRTVDIAALRPELLALASTLQAGIRVVPGSLRRVRDALVSPESTSGLDALARLAGLSSAHLSRLFTKTWGIPTSQYRKQLRLLAATRMLLEGRGVTEAALEAGFSDAAHLSRTFSAQYGVSPSAWRKAMAR